MRPVRRGASPQQGKYDDFHDAKPDLVGRLGSYCSYCERRIYTNLAVEHIQPKGLPKYAALVGEWTNFLLACVNCNSTKKDKDVHPQGFLLPDRDNTAEAYSYEADGLIKIPNQKTWPEASATLALVGLDKPVQEYTDKNGRLVALDRVAQRMEAWLIALESKGDIDQDPNNLALRRAAVRTALACGFFSVWMTVFSADKDMRVLFIDAFNGTRESECFAPQTSAPVSPAPNPDALPHGGKI
jgi:hypothetical protein